MVIFVNCKKTKRKKNTKRDIIMKLHIKTYHNENDYSVQNVLYDVDI